MRPDSNMYTFVLPHSSYAYANYHRSSSGLYLTRQSGRGGRMLLVCRGAALTGRVAHIQPQAPPAASPSILLNVSGMKCGGCSAAVKRILSQQPGVAAAAVNLLTETAAIQVAPEFVASMEGVVADAAAALSSKGFPAVLRGSGEQDSSAEALKAAATRKEKEVQEK
jgi:copper chaperone CopZ